MGVMHTAVSRTSRLMVWIADNVDERGWIDRWRVQGKGRELELRTVVQLYGSVAPWMEQVPGTRFAQPTQDGLRRIGRA